MDNSNIEQIKKSILSSEVVSFDIFDTLIVRLTAKAEDVFKIIEHKTGIINFASKREKLQSECSMLIEQTKKEPHATFDDIYDYLEKNANLDLKGYTWQQLKAMELEVEQAVLIRNTPMYEVYLYAKEQGKRVIATSDMYLGAKEILPILNSCGYTDFDAVYVSADVKKTKYRLDLFDYVSRCENVSPNNIIHIGDNYEHDVVNSQKCGFNSFHYSGNRNKADLSLYQSISTGVSCYLKNCEQNFWYNLGAEVGGPLYCGFIDQIKESISKTKPDKLFLLARDGYNLFNILKNIDLIDIDTEYMYASRRAMLLCGIDKLDKPSLEVLPPYTFGQTVKEILDYLDLGEVSETSVKKCGFSGFNAIIKNLEDIEKFKKIFSLEEKLFFKTAAQERENFKNYLNKIGFLDSKALVFDCGWNGSSQYLLDRALRLSDYDNRGENTFIYVGLMNSTKCKKQLKDKKYSAILFDQSKNNTLYKRLSRSIVILELFFGAPHGSVWKYANNENGFIEENVEKEYSYKNEILRGIIDFINIAYPLLNKLEIPATAEDCLANVFRLIEKPTLQEATKIGDLENIDGFVANKNQKKYIAKLTLEDIKSNPNELYWPQGIYAREDIDEKVKLYVKGKTGVEMPNKKPELQNKAPNVFQRVAGYIKDYGLITTTYLINKKLKEKGQTLPYDYYIEQCDKDILATTDLEYRPLISFVVPVYNVVEYQLRECIDSILAQTYDNFELILVDDKSTWDIVPKVLKEYENNPKITVIYRKENGHISRSTNTGIEVAKGEYIAFTDCDDVVAPNAVYEITKLLNEDSSLDFIYSDEDKLTEDSKHRHFPHFKPDWSPDTFMSHMYTSHLSAYRKRIVDEIGGLRVGFEGAQDYDFTMRFVEKTNKVGHIPKVLYYWRQRPESTSSDLNSKPYVMDAMLNLKKETLERRGLEGEIVYVPDVRQYRVIYNPKDNPLVSIIIPSKDNYDMLKQCITSIVDKTNYKNYEIIVVDNGSSATNKKAYESLLSTVKAVYHYEKMPFNFSKMCNLGASLSKGSYLLFLNDDIEVVDNDWLKRMVGQASLEHTGAVGAKLLYPNSTYIQHCGVINLPTGPCHAFSHLDDSVPHYFCRNKLEYNYIAVTAACLCVSKAKFNEVKGFDEELTVSYNDIDLCFKLYEKGYYNTVRNDAILYHYESFSRGLDAIDSAKKERLTLEFEKLCKKHPALDKKDPFYNINFSPNRVDFQVNFDRFKKRSKVIASNIKIDNILTDRIKACIDSVTEGSIIELTGWGFIAAMPLNNLNKKSIVLIDKDNNCTKYSTDIYLRMDVTKAFGKGGNLNLSGFSCSIDSSTLKSGRYQIGLVIENKFMFKKYAVLFDNYITI